MKVLKEDAKKLVIYLLDNEKLHLGETHILEEELKEIFINLKYRYHINVEGFYYVKLYLDDKMAVIELDGSDTEDLFYLDGEVDMHIEIIHKKFIYTTKELLDIPDYILKKSEVFIYDDNYLIRPKKTLTFKEVGILLEYTTCNYNYQDPYIFDKKIY